MISVEKFLEAVEKNRKRIHAYETGHDGSDGTCDCIGLIMGALELTGEKWNGEHGTNWAWRYGPLTNRRPPSEGLKKGDVVFKYHPPGEAGYDMPDRYKNSGDLNDYYHIGVVMSVSPLKILHCTSVPGGTMEDSTLGRWQRAAELIQVDYSGGSQEGGDDPVEEAVYQAEVFQPEGTGGGTVWFRKGPHTYEDAITGLPFGTIVDVFEDLGEWMKIGHGGRVGYMMAKFLRKTGETVSGEIPRELRDEFVRYLQAMK